MERFSGEHILGCLVNSQEVRMTITSLAESGRESFWVCRKGFVIEEEEKVSALFGTWQTIRFQEWTQGNTQREYDSSRGKYEE